MKKQISSINNKINELDSLLKKEHNIVKKNQIQTRIADNIERRNRYVSDYIPLVAFRSESEYFIAVGQKF